MKGKKKKNKGNKQVDRGSQGRIAGFTVVEIEVYYEDTDCGGVVYYANYLRYFERARTRYLTARNISLADYQQKGVVFTVVTAKVDYRAPAVYGDTLIVETKIDTVKGSSFTVHYEIRRKRDGLMIVTGSTRMACINRDEKKPIRIPAEIRDVLVSAPNE